MKILFGIDDVLHYYEAVLFLKYGDFFTLSYWLPLNRVIASIYLFVIPSIPGVTDLAKMLTLNWAYYFLTIAILVFGLPENGRERWKTRGLIAAVLFVSIKFVHQLGFSILTENLQYLLITGIVVFIDRFHRNNSPKFFVLYLIFALSWMFLRFEGWLAMIAFGICYFFFAREKGWRRYHGLLFMIPPMCFLLMNTIFLGSPLIFMKHHLATTAELDTASLLYVLLSNSFLIFIAILVLPFIFLPEKIKTDNLPRELISPSVVLATILLFVMILLGERGLLGYTFPARFPVQVLIAYIPFASKIYAHLLRKCGEQGGPYILVFYLAFPAQLIITYQSKLMHDSFLNHFIGFHSAVEVTMKEDKNIVVVTFPDSNPYHPGFPITSLLYDWRHVEKMELDSSSDLKREVSKENNYIVLTDIWESDSLVIEGLDDFERVNGLNFVFLRHAE